MTLSHVPSPFFAGEEKRPGIHHVFARKVDIFPFPDRSLPLYARICTTENQMIADAVALGYGLRADAL